MQYHTYNTGDQVWTSQRYGKQTVVKVITHDGMVWSEEEPKLTRLEGAEKFIHQIQVFCMKWIWKVLNS
jgi:hypothetical protein